MSGLYNFLSAFFKAKLPALVARTDMPRVLRIWRADAFLGTETMVLFFVGFIYLIYAIVIGFYQLSHTTPLLQAENDLLNNRPVGAASRSKAKIPKNLRDLRDIHCL